MKPWRLLCLAAGLAVVTGCRTPVSSTALPRTGDPVTDGRAAVERGPARDRVLWEYRTALAALRRGQPAAAKSMLDDALLTLGGISAGDKDARRARGMFREEARKTFRGEPYERAMAYYYRGILYWMDGEPDNARACFRNAQFQDSDTENHEYAGDFVLMDYLDGLATAKLAGDGTDAFKRAEAGARITRPPPYDRAANVLIFVEFGRGPLKYATGEYGEQLRFRPGAPGPRAAVVRVAGAAYRLDPYDDLYFQATTRGGRVMDHVLANKAVFKSTTDAVGDVGLVSGLILSQRRETRDVGLGLAAAGLLSKIVSAATTPAADTRTWETLPQYLSFVALRLPPGTHTLTVEFLGDGGSPNPGLTKTISIPVADGGRDTVVFVSDQPS